MFCCCCYWSSRGNLPLFDVDELFIIGLLFDEAIGIDNYNSEDICGINVLFIIIIIDKKFEF